MKKKMVTNLLNPLNVACDVLDKVGRVSINRPVHYELLRERLQPRLIEVHLTY